MAARLQGCCCRGSGRSQLSEPRNRRAGYSTRWRRALMYMAAGGAAAWPADLLGVAVSVQAGVGAWERGPLSCCPAPGAGSLAPPARSRCATWPCWRPFSAAPHLAPITDARPVPPVGRLMLITDARSSCARGPASAPDQAPVDGRRPPGQRQARAGVLPYCHAGAGVQPQRRGGLCLQRRGLGHGVAPQGVGPRDGAARHDVLALLLLPLRAGARQAAARRRLGRHAVPHQHALRSTGPAQQDAPPQCRAGACARLLPRPSRVQAMLAGCLGAASRQRPPHTQLRMDSTSSGRRVHGPPGAAAPPRPSRWPRWWASCRGCGRGSRPRSGCRPSST